ncbi:MAG: endonuclease V [Thermodesulfobacteriota bacterium]|nr:endonuclease V [Thermodesulfobacteriota bacterium]
MILAVDVDYKETSALVAGVSFNTWDDSHPKRVYTSCIENINEYEPGSFYKRELPCIFSLLKEHKLKPDIIVIDGFVYLDGVKKIGLGKHLYDSLRKETIVIGVAKRPFKDIGYDYAIYRCRSRKPLYVTAEGVDLNQAFEAITQMHGEFRIPDLLKKVDQVCRRKC